jgi:DNA invertase Pin-like site-specific DNA recombinase
MIALFGFFAEVERDLISVRTKEGLVAARARGRLLGRPKGSLGTSKLDGKEGEIQKLLEKEVSKRSLAKIMDVADQPPPLHPDPKTRPGDLERGGKTPGATAASLRVSNFTPDLKS